MEIVTFTPDLQKDADAFFQICFSELDIPYAPMDRHADIADIAQHYMQNGCFWCLLDDGMFLGTVALRPLPDNDAVELKRMFVLPSYQRKGYGRMLLEHAIAHAKEQGFHKLCLDTRRQFSAAQHLYQSCGFRETEKYNNNERAELYFELILS